MARPVGYSDHSEEKQRMLREFCHGLFRVQKRILGGTGKVHPEALMVDLNAGPGIVHGLSGSPLIILEEALAAALPFHLWACDAVPSRLEQLREALYQFVRDFWAVRVINSATHAVTCLRGCPACSPPLAMQWVDQHVTFVAGDHNVTVHQIVAEMMQRAKYPLAIYGMVYADGNGQRDYAINPLSVLAQHRRLACVDFLVNVNASVLKRTRLYGKKAAASGQPNVFSEKYAETFLMARGLDAIPKHYTHVHEPRGEQQWTAFVLTNYEKLPVPRGFARTDSPRGRAIVERVELAPDEIETGQLPLFGPLPGPTPSISDTRPTELFGTESSSDLADVANDAAAGG